MATNVFDQFDQQAANPFDQFDAPVAQKPEKTGMLRAAADIPVQVGRGVAVGVKALSDVFGADNPVSRAASGVEDFLGGLLSAQAKNDQTEIARIMKEAQDKGVGEQVVAAVKAFSTAPVDMLSQALGTAVPVIAGGLAGSIARLGAAGVGAIGTGVGAAMGAGTVKGQIYDAVKQELLENKVPEVEAEKRAQEAQAYGGKNLDQILMGAGIGAAEAAFGAERILTGLLRKGAVKPSTLPAKYRIPTAAATEAVPEMAQAAQEQVAQNIALQREGYDVPTMRGVVGQAALEGLAGAGLGAITGAVERTEAAKPEARPPKAEAPKEPQQAEAEAPKPVTGEAGIVRPEEETPISREVAKEVVPELSPPAMIAPSVPATKVPVAENYADMTVDALRSAKENADETNLQMDLSAIRTHFGEDAATAYAGMNRRQRNKWWDANATESFERDSSVFNGVNEETIDEYIQAYNKFDTESPQSLGRSIALIARKINDPDFIGSPEYLTLKNALSYAKEQGWSEKQVLDAMRGRASEWAGSDAQELFKDLFKGVPKQAATTQTGSSLTKREELKALPQTVSPKPGIAEDRQRAEPVVEAAAPEPVVTEAEAAKPEEVPAAPDVVPQAEIARPEVMPPKKEIDRQALEEKRQTILDMIETKKERREPIPEGWIEKLTEISAQLRGEKVDREEIYSMEVAGHPMFDGPPVLRNLIPIKVKNAEAAQRALDRALELERQVLTEFSGAKYALQSAKTAAQKKRHNLVLKN